ncbi:MAG: nucleotidyltransferase [Bacilli bacterium]|nr:nucleotidyltransferase [Bacilli bacterium]
MNIIGIIGEYNPIHLGHIYQINKIKEQFPNSLIILITNSCFTQRGNISIINKWDKTTISLNNQIDLVVELPFVYATQSADIFAKGALYILNKLKIDTLVFGTESNDLNKINKIVDTQLYNKKYEKIIKENLKKGINYPTAASNALKTILGYTTNEPNNLLAISYIKEIKRNNYNINAVSIKRTNNYHAKEIKSNIINASLIRNMLNEKKDISKYIPKQVANHLYNNINNESYFPYLKYKITETSDLSIYQTIEEGIDNRIKKAIISTNSWEELIKKVKTKRYTYNKINRMLIHILTGFTKEDAKNIEINYIRVLGFNSKGRKHLNNIKKELDLPIITNYKPNLSKLLDIELKAISIYDLPINDNLIEKEYKNNPIIKK